MAGQRLADPAVQFQSPGHALHIVTHTGSAAFQADLDLTQRKRQLVAEVRGTLEALIRMAVHAVVLSEIE